MLITDIWRYPVKSLQGERVDSAMLGPDGIEGDRAWSLVDVDSGLNLTARREPRLLFASASVVDDGGEPAVTITIDAGETLADDEALSRWLGRAVTLRRADPDAAGTYETTLDEAEQGDWVRWNGPTGSFHDSTRSKVSIVAAATFGAWDPRRFRINIVTDGAAGQADALVGSTVAVGQAVVEVTKQIDRCIMVSRPQPAHESSSGLERDLEVLHAVNRDRDGVLGVGALIRNPGLISVGDLVVAV